MAPVTYRANLTAAEFPFLSELQGRNVIISSIDQNFSRQSSSVKDKDRDIGIPQVYYCHNAMPTDAGMVSVGFLPIASYPADSDNAFSKVFILRDVNDNKAYLGVTTTGRCYVLLNGATGWIRTTDVAPVAGLAVTTAYVGGITYIYFGGVGCYKYNFATNALDSVTLTALSAPDIIGICAANGYMIAVTKSAVAWSSAVTATDFTPSLATGAGGGNVQLLKAAITTVVPNAIGFTVFTKTNAIVFVYTGNGQYPFNNKEILGAGGLASTALICYDGNSANQYAYTTSGLQAISGNQSQVVFPEATDFLAGSQFEDFDETTARFTVTSLGSPMQKRVTIISNRYLVLSYGINSLTHALVYDFALARWGKLKVNHVDCFEYTVPDPAVVETPKRSIGFLQQDGTVKVAVLSYETSIAYGVLVLGKYQLERNTYTTMSELHLENIRAGNNLLVKLLTTLDGKNFTVTTPALAANTGLYRRYNCKATGLNHSFVIAGAFHMNSVELKVMPNGTVR